MNVAIFIPCYIDQFYPEVGVATFRLLEKVGIKPHYPLSQVCCGQPMANSGCQKEVKPIAKKYYDLFHDYDYVVCPSGSCTSMIRNHYHSFFNDSKDTRDFLNKTYELTEFLVDIVSYKPKAISFPYRVGFHHSCHGLRELGLAKSSEKTGPFFSKARNLLNKIKDLKLVTLKREDECCGFGGMFSTYQETISCQMGEDRLMDHKQAGAQVITGVDMSCLMHLEGLLKRKKSKIKILHLANILLGEKP